jgi:hypothetical protein
MQPSNSSRNNGDLKLLLAEYIALCNRALAGSKERYWYKQVLRSSRALLGDEARIRTLIYAEDPDNVLGEFVVRFDPKEPALSLQPGGEQPPPVSWRVSAGYLRDVVYARPEWYLERPARLDWMWLKERVRDEVAQRVDVRSLLAGFALVALVAALLAPTHSKHERAS